jgi:hypothetical protein
LFLACRACLPPSAHGRTGAQPVNGFASTASPYGLRP